MVLRNREVISLSTEGAEYVSQASTEQSEVRRPWTATNINEALKVRNTFLCISLFQSFITSIFPRCDASRFARRLPLPFIFRTFGAQKK